MKVAKKQMEMDSDTVEADRDGEVASRVCRFGQ